MNTSKLEDYGTRIRDFGRNFLEVNGKTLGVLIRHPFSVIRFPQDFKVAELL